MVKQSYSSERKPYNDFENRWNWNYWNTCVKKVNFLSIKEPDMSIQFYVDLGWWILFFSRTAVPSNHSEDPQKYVPVYPLLSYGFMRKFQGWQH